jgi:hypothetical protein
MNILGKSRATTIDKLYHNGVSVDTVADIPNVFNDFFTSVALELRHAIPNNNVSPLDHMGDCAVNDINAELATCGEVSGVISALASKGSRLSTIPSFVFKAINDVISRVVCELFNSTLLEGVFPDNLKIAEVIPIHKSGSITMVNNFRPISTLPILSKVFERLMKARLVRFFGVTNFFSIHQFGFRSGYETNDAILEFLDFSYKSLDSKRHLVSIFLDLSKAFDTLDHGILLAKLSHVGIRGRVLGWLSSYLTDRKQFTTVNDHCSDIKNIIMGVPQGSVLGPLLFLVYINDMSKSSDLLNFVHFADDTTLYLSGEDLTSLCNVVNSELLKVDTWLTTNKLSLNVKKNTYMIMSHSVIPADLSINIRNRPLARVDVTKFLGLSIDSGLTFGDQVNQMCSKISKAIGIMYKLSSYVPPDGLVNLYFSLVHSHFIYGITSWGGSAMIHLNKLCVLQRRAINLLPGTDNISKVKYFKILTVDSLYKYFCGIKLFKSYKLGTHKYFQVSFNNLLPVHDYNTRHRVNENFNIPYCHKSRSQCSFYYSSSKIWNSLPTCIKNSQSLSSFKYQFKSFLLNSQTV